MQMSFVPDHPFGVPPDYYASPVPFFPPWPVTNPQPAIQSDVAQLGPASFVPPGGVRYPRHHPHPVLAVGYNQDMPQDLKEYLPYQPHQVGNFAPNLAMYDSNPVMAEQNVQAQQRCFQDAAEANALMANALSFKQDKPHYSQQYLPYRSHQAGNFAPNLSMGGFQHHSNPSAAVQNVHAQQHSLQGATMTSALNPNAISFNQDMPQDLKQYLPYRSHQAGNFAPNMSMGGSQHYSNPSAAVQNVQAQQRSLQGATMTSALNPNAISFNQDMPQDLKQYLPYRSHQAGNFAPNLSMGGFQHHSNPSAAVQNVQAQQHSLQGATMTSALNPNAISFNQDMPQDLKQYLPYRSHQAGNFAPNLSMGGSQHYSNPSAAVQNVQAQQRSLQGATMTSALNPNAISFNQDMPQDLKQYLPYRSHQAGNFAPNLSMGGFQHHSNPSAAVQNVQAQQHSLQGATMTSALNPNAISFNQDMPQDLKQYLPYRSHQAGNFAPNLSMGGSQHYSNPSAAVQNVQAQQRSLQGATMTSALNPNAISFNQDMPQDLKQYLACRSHQAGNFAPNLSMGGFQHYSNPSAEMHNVQAQQRSLQGATIPGASMPNVPLPLPVHWDNSAPATPPGRLQMGVQRCSGSEKTPGRERQESIGEFRPYRLFSSPQDVYASPSDIHGEPYDDAEPQKSSWTFNKAVGQPPY